MKGFKLVYYTTTEPKDITNAIFMVGAYLCVCLGATPEEAWQPFHRLAEDLCLPYRDATWVKSPYDLHVKDCWSALIRAMNTGLYNFEQFDKHEVTRLPSYPCSCMPACISCHGVCAR
jgi:hypothetical protein